MKNSLYLLTAVLLLAACGNRRNTPDVSNISLKVEIARFDQELFQLDTLQLGAGLAQLAEKEPSFYNDYMNYMLGVSGLPTDSATLEVTRFFLRTYRGIYDSIQPVYLNTRKLQKELEQSYRLVKYYFPSYNPGKIWLHLGPFDAPGVAAVQGGMAIGLQQFAGASFSAYLNPQVLELFPSYLSRRFSPEYVVPNTLKAIAEDLFPYKAAGQPLLEQMVEKGKYWYLTDLFLPETADSLKTGFTTHQLEWCFENEGLIWSHLLKSEELQSLNPVVIQNYIGEGPFTQGLSQEDSPGNIGPWIGWQIVKKYVKKFPELTPEQIMQTPASEILEKARYKPK
jgi:hypothetical protein